MKARRTKDGATADAFDEWPHYFTTLQAEDSPDVKVKVWRNGAQLLRAIAVAYEVQIDLVRAICLHEFKKDHIAHLGPSVAAGLGALLELDTDTVYQAIQQAVHVSFSTRQSRKGFISSWKAFAAAHAGKIGIEAVDRAMPKGKALVKLLNWTATTGQQFAKKIDYVPLPKNIQKLATTQLKTVK